MCTNNSVIVVEHENDDNRYTTFVEAVRHVLMVRLVHDDDDDDKRHCLAWASIRLLSVGYTTSPLAPCREQEELQLPLELDWGDLDYFVAEDSHNRMHRLPPIDQRFRSITLSKLTDPETERARYILAASEPPPVSLTRKLLV
jgi:hypothetical protein